MAKMPLTSIISSLLPSSPAASLPSPIALIMESFRGIRRQITFDLKADRLFMFSGKI